MASWKELNSLFSSVQSFFFTVKKVIQELRKEHKNYPKRFGSDGDFVLRVAPLNEKKHDSYRNYFPLPRYGIPAGKLGELPEYHTKNHAKYGLFLWPDHLYMNIRHYFFLLLFTLLPFIWLGIETNDWSYFLVAGVLLFIAFFIKPIFTFYARRAPPVLSNIWSLWPESQYNRFLTVPHLSELAVKDEKKADITDKKGEIKYQKYWAPDKSGTLLYQPSYYAKGKKTLQEVMLHLALFDYLFVSDKAVKNTRKISSSLDLCRAESQNHNSLRLKGWFYLLAPAIISYALLFVAFFVSSLVYPPKMDCIPVLLRLPFFYVPLILIWSCLTFSMILRQMRFLETLQKKVKEGYYDTHLDLIPQQLLTVISKIPSDKQISKGMDQVAAVLRWVQAGALATFLIVLEIFAAGF